MNIFLTGAAGFIGSHFTKKLLQNGHTVIGLDNFDPFYNKSIKESNLERLKTFKSFNFIEGDIRDKNVIGNIFKEYTIDLVVHLAAKAGVRPSIEDPSGYFEVNVNGTINILDQMVANNINKMLFASSSSVYGNNEKVPFSEKDNVDNPISPYAASKKSCELICSTYNTLHNIKIFAFRFFTVYGPSQRPEMAIAKFTNAIINNEPITLFDGKGNTSRDYTFINDIVDGLYSSLDKVKGYEIFNLGESKTVKLIELVRIIESKLKKKAHIIFGEKQPGDVQTTFADISKANKILGYSPKVNIDEGIELYCNSILNRS
jgi:UDP-glucuronate 4-epimerase